MKTFDFISDPGHAWLKVPVSFLLELGIADKITTYSYYRAGFAYLEEDLDAGTFIGAMQAAGRPFKFRERVARERRSKVRGYFCYTPAIAHNLSLIQAAGDRIVFAHVGAA
jgi:hypothetical protein